MAENKNDRRHHGGPDKAVHAYPVQSYPLWTADLPDLAAEMRPGTFSENLVVEGAVEADVCLGGGQDTGRTGWYFRILEAGEISAGDTAHLVARPHPDWPLDRVWKLLYRNTQDRRALSAFAALPGLTDRWRALAEARVYSGRTENWSRRIEAPQ